MPFTATEITEAGKITLDFFLKNNPIDQVAVERPLLKTLMAESKEFGAAKQYVTEQLRYRYQSNFQWFNGDSVVTYNKRKTQEQANYPWRSAHDGFSLSEDELAQNGITIHDGASGQASGAERAQLVNLLEENTEALRLGFEEKFSYYVSQDGTSSTDAVAGLDLLVATDPTTGTVGGINRATSGNEYWRNNKSLSIAQNALLAAMETMWRGCIKNGGRPNKILAGGAFIDDYIAALRADGQQINFNGGEQRKGEGAYSGVYWKGIEIEWCPEWDDDFGGLVSPTPSWNKRCYFLNTKFIKLRPMAGQNMITRKPPRVYDKYTYYWALTWRGAMTMGRANAHAVLGLD